MNFDELSDLLSKGPILVELYDGLKIYLETSLLDKKEFIGQFSLCCGGSKPTIISYREIKRIINQ